MTVENLPLEKLHQHPVHRDMLGDPTEVETEKDLSSLDEAFDRKKKLHPVLYVTMEGDEKLYVIDGWSSVLKYREKGWLTIPGIKVDLDNPDELPYLMADLHTNYHNDPAEDFQKFSYFYNILSPGRGYRSDLDNNEE